MSSSQRKGLKSLKRRIKQGELLVVESDKSGKFVVCSTVAYIQMGNSHAANDEEILNEQVKDIQNKLRGHTSMRIKLISFRTKNRGLESL